MVRRDKVKVKSLIPGVRNPDMRFEVGLVTDVVRVSPVAYSVGPPFGAQASHEQDHSGSPFYSFDTVLRQAI